MTLLGCFNANVMKLSRKNLYMNKHEYLFTINQDLEAFYKHLKLGLCDMTKKMSTVCHKRCDL